MFVEGIAIALFFCIVICVQMVMIVTWSERHQQLLKRIQTLEKKRREPQLRLPPQIEGKLHISLNGQTRTLDAQFKPASTTLKKRYPR